MEKYLFFDRGLFNGYQMSNAKISLNQIKKEGKVFFKEDFFSEPQRRWEVRYDNGYPNVIYDEEEQLYRCYYTLFTYDEDSEHTPLSERPGRQYQPTAGRITSLCYAQSKDGVNWEKPELNLVEFEGSRKNNILFRYAHGTSVFLDKEEPDRKKRYKLMTKVEYSANRHFMAVGFSEDGIHFGRLKEWPNYNPQADTHNFAFRDVRTGKFILITRVWKNGLRVVAKSESQDFINWSEPVEITRGQGFEDQIYSMPVFYYNGVYLGLASTYHEGDMTAEDYDTVDVRLKFSTNLDNWDEVAWGQNFIERGAGTYPNGEFDCGCIYASVPVLIGEKLYFYYMGGNGQHTNYRETSFSRGFVEKDRLAYYSQKNDAKEAVLQLRSFYFYGKELSLLADIEEEGSVTIELTDQSGNLLEGFGQSELVKEKDRWNIRFPGRSNEELVGKECFIRIRFEKARLYGIMGDMALVKKKY